MKKNPALTKTMTLKKACSQNKNGITEEAIVFINNKFRECIIKRLIKSSNGLISNDDGNDIFHDGIVEFIKNTSFTYKSDYQTQNYIFMICRNLMIKRIKSILVIKKISDDVETEIVDKIKEWEVEYEESKNSETKNRRSNIYKKLYKKTGINLEDPFLKNNAGVSEDVLRIVFGELEYKAPHILAYSFFICLEFTYKRIIEAADILFDYKTEGNCREKVHNLRLLIKNKVEETIEKMKKDDRRTYKQTSKSGRFSFN